MRVRMCYLYVREIKGRRLIIIVLALGTYIYMANTRMYSYVYSLDSQSTQANTVHPTSGTVCPGIYT
jgi:hypothetical protein